MSTDTDTEGRDRVGITSVFIVLVFTCNESLFVDNRLRSSTVDSEKSEK